MYLGHPTQAGHHCDSQNSKLGRMCINPDIQWAPASNWIPVRPHTNPCRGRITRSSSLRSERHNRIVRLTGTRLWKDVHTMVKFTHEASFISPGHAGHTAQDNLLCPVPATHMSGCDRFLRTSRCRKLHDLNLGHSPGSPAARMALQTIEGPTSFPDAGPFLRCGPVDQIGDVRFGVHRRSATFGTEQIIVLFPPDFRCHSRHHRCQTLMRQL